MNQRESIEKTKQGFEESFKADSYYNKQTRDENHLELILIHQDVLLLLLNIKANKYAKPTAAEIPAAVDIKPPFKTPKRPNSFNPFMAPFARALPKPIIGTVAPAPAKSTNLS